MIIGIGTDITDIRRIKKLLEKSGARFEEKIFTAGERKKARSRKAGMAATYAKRFAAKEACIKALSTRHIAWHDMEVSNLENGAPTLALKGDALKQLKKLTPRGKKARILLSLSDEYPYALAWVIVVAE